MNPSNIIVISPHPDDLEIAMGGTVSKLIDKGKRVISVVVTDGRGSTNLNNVNKHQLAKIRKNEVEKSSEILGIKDIICLDISDVKLKGNQLKLEKTVAEFLEKYKPLEIYIPHPEIDKHATHKIVADISIKAHKNLKNSRFKPAVWCYEVWTPFPAYDRIEDITDYVNLKLEAIAAHKSQTGYKDYAEGILGLNRYRAVFNDIYEKIENRYAEVFIKYKQS